MTMPRRSRKNIDLPDNLYPNGKYFRYIHPHTHKKISLNCSRKEAIQLAIAANNELQRSPAIIVRDDYIPDLIERFKTEFLPDKGYAESTLTGKLSALERYKKEFKHNISELDVRTLSLWLDKLSRASYIKNRGLWIDIYRYAIAKGLTTFNVAEATLVKKPAKRKRDRLALEAYKEIYALAEPWFQVAMDAALHTLQRRGDLVQVKLDDFQADTLPIIQSKTGMAIKIKANDGLKSLIHRSRWSGTSSPFLVHKKPVRSRREYLDKKEHHTQVTPPMLTKEFSKLRNKAGIKPAPGKKPTTFHEIRSLGGRLLVQQGYSEEFVQVLMGHTNIKMTEKYLEDGTIKWTMAEAGLMV